MATYIQEPEATQLDLTDFVSASLSSASGTVAASRRSEQKYVVITRGCSLKRLQEADRNPYVTLDFGGYRTQFPTYNGGDRDEISIELSHVRLCAPAGVHSTISFFADVSIGEASSIAVTVNYDTVAEAGFFRVG